MKKKETECVSCGLPCMGTACPNYEVTRFYCDECESEDTLYHYDDKELCIDCIKKKLEVVEGSEEY